MNCSICKRETKYFPTENGKISETFRSISWEHVDKKEFELRKEDGRGTSIGEVCPDCYEKYSPTPALGLHDLNEIRERGITKEQYLKEKGY